MKPAGRGGRSPYKYAKNSSMDAVWSGKAEEVHHNVHWLIQPPVLGGGRQIGVRSQPT